jgi:hypothetical protein
VDSPDEIMTLLGKSIELIGSGERESARQLLTGLWEQVGPDGDALHRCAVAHHLADVQNDAREELAWDLRALQAADSITDERAAQAGVPGPAAGLYPSLHLNLGEDYRKLGDRTAARHHLTLGQAAASALGDDGYSTMIRRGLDALAVRLAGQ